ncbi:TERF1-interacting nuclear factor 2 isoform X2 [Nyctibius grandis]|uniref:TERF1-interacting nuclear factor 2 isoform X2 n=1 Tax=Nyctibius grandis TaxID=48427 RepID=UPI0035BC2149
MAGKGIRRRSPAPAPPPAAALRLALAGAWRALRGRSPAQFPRVLGLLEAVGRAAPGAVTFLHGARLRLGLRAAVVVWMLREAEPDGKILDAVDTFFPEGEPLPGHAHAAPRELEMVAEAQESFREMALELLGDRARREAYLQGPAEREYGERFLAALEGLLYEFLRRVESGLPPPEIDQLHELLWRHAPSGPRPPGQPILSQYLCDMGHAGQLPRPLAARAPPTRVQRQRLGGGRAATEKGPDPTHFRPRPAPPRR